MGIGTHCALERGSARVLCRLNAALRASGSVGYDERNSYTSSSWLDTVATYSLNK